MPFYHKKHPKHGRRSAYQVTKQWKDELIAKELERKEKKLKRKQKRFIKKQNEKIKHREEMAYQKEKTKELKRLDKERFEATKKIQEHNYYVAAKRVERSELWWRENANKEKELEQQRQIEYEQLQEFKRKERQNELKENWDMKMAEEETLMYLSICRMTNEQIYMRKLGTIEAIYNTEKKITNVHLQSRAAQNMRELDLHIISRNLKLDYQDDDDDDTSEDDDDKETMLQLKDNNNNNTKQLQQHNKKKSKTKKQKNVNDDDDDLVEDLTYIEDGWQYTLSHDLIRYPDANKITCTKFGVVGAKLLAKELAPPLPQGYNESKALQTSTEAISIKDLNLGPGACPVLLTLNLNYNNIGNRGFVALSKAFRWGAVPQLRNLYLISNRISDGGLLEFVNAINQGGVNYLTKLSLRQNVLSDQSVVELAHALLQFKLPKLVELDLKSNRIREKGCRAMCAYARSASVPTIVNTCMDKNTRKERNLTNLEYNESHGLLQNINLSCNYIDRKKLRRFVERAPSTVCF